MLNHLIATYRMEIVALCCAKLRRRMPAGPVKYKRERAIPAFLDQLANTLKFMFRGSAAPLSVAPHRVQLANRRQG